MAERETERDQEIAPKRASKLNWRRYMNDDDSADKPS